MKQYLLSPTKKRQYILALGDIIVVLLAIFVSYIIRVYITYRHPSMAIVFSRMSPWLLFVVLAHIFTLYLFDQYNLDELVKFSRSAVFQILSIWSAGLLISSSFFFLPKYVFGRQVLLIHLLMLTIGLVLWRLLFTAGVLRKASGKRLAFVGNGQIVSSFIEELARIKNHGFEVRGVCIASDSSELTCPVSSSLQKYEDLMSLLECNDFDVLAFDSTNGMFSDKEIRAILEIKYRGKAVYDLPRLYKNLTGKVPLTYIDGRWLLNSDGLQGEASVPYARIKRILDVILSVLLIVAVSPIMLIIGVAIKLNSKGKIFYVQERLGLEKRPFRCLKFRTMFEEAEKESGPIWSKERDPRTTQVGRFLRKTRLDELPQLWNILKGEMSFVGPRPIREHFANQLAQKIPFYDLRFGVKPGLTGWAQVNYDYAGSEVGQMEKFQYELFYIENMSLLLDLLTIMRTINKVVKIEGT